MMIILIIYLSCCVLNLVISIFNLYKQYEAYKPITLKDILICILFILGSLVSLAKFICLTIYKNWNIILFRKE